MRRALLALIFVSACVSTTGRKPTGQAFSACQNAFARADAELVVDWERNHQLNMIRKGFEYLVRVYPNEVRDLLVREKPICERSRDFNDTDKDVRAKLAYVSQYAKILDAKEAELSELAQTAMMTDPEFARASVCVLGCGTQKGDKCAEACGVTEKFIDSMAANKLFMKLYIACAPQTGDFGAQMERYLPRWRRDLKNALWPAYHELTLLARSASAALAGIRLNLKAEKSEEGLGDCALPAPRWQTRVRGFTEVVQGPGGRGTAFYVSAAGRVRLVTAAHIYGEWPFATPPPADQPRSSVTLPAEPEPGLFDTAADILQTRVTDRSAGLPVVDAQIRPRINQNFYLVGYPQVRDYRFTVYRCTLYGYGPPTVAANAPMYVLRCPNVDGHIAGMSGGPVLDEAGKVWGVITEHNPFLARVYASPLSVDAQNNVRMGFSEMFTAQQCVMPFEVERRFCQVNPR